MPPSGLRSRNFAIGEPSPSGSSSSILVFGRVMNTVVTPWSGCGTAAETSAPSTSRETAAVPMSRTAIATWFSLPIMSPILGSRFVGWIEQKRNSPPIERWVSQSPTHPTRRLQNVRTASASEFRLQLVADRGEDASLLRFGAGENLLHDFLRRAAAPTGIAEIDIRRVANHVGAPRGGEPLRNGGEHRAGAERHGAQQVGGDMQPVF